MTRSGICTYFGQALFTHAAPSAILAPDPDGTIRSSNRLYGISNEKAYLHPVGPSVR
jgi:hypothetical protein